ncbi:MAG: HlyD family efflux transporter periplasmic adaptor subunit [Treponema sp.]|nr:HlyD family efflux transporter periplasmic adaptor subunit [Treponema sp.]
MKKIVVLKHQNDMKFSKEFFQMEIPKELSFIVYVIGSICLAVFLLIIAGHIDDVIKTNGYVRTKYNVSSVHNVIAGKIVELNYKPGEKVLKGDTLYKIDSSIYEAQKNFLVYEKEDLEKKITGLNSLANSYKFDRNICDINDPLSYSRFDAYLKNKSVLEIRAKIAEKEYDYENQKPETLRNSYDIGLKLQSYKLAVAELNSFKSTFIAEINSELNEELNMLFKNQQNLAELENHYIFLESKSPMDGYVQEIASLNVGDYLEANSEVLKIIPNDNENFRVEIWISPKDMGKIKVGQKVKYRLSAFPFFEYKGADGIITSIDHDIRKSEDGSRVYYSVYADIDRINFSNRHGDTFPIRAGLETDVRIVMEQKPIIYFILKKLDFIN